MHLTSLSNIHNFFDALLCTEMKKETIVVINFYSHIPLRLSRKGIYSLPLIPHLVPTVSHLGHHKRRGFIQVILVHLLAFTRQVWLLVPFLERS